METQNQHEHWINTAQHCRNWNQTHRKWI